MMGLAPIWWVDTHVMLDIIYQSLNEFKSTKAIGFLIVDCYNISSNYHVLFIFCHQRSKAPLTRSDSGNSDDNYVPMNPGSSPLSAAQADSPKNIYIPMSPGPHHFDFPGFSATLPARKGSCASLCHRPSRLSDVTPPPINRNLKPNRKCSFFYCKFSLIYTKAFLVCFT